MGWNYIVCCTSLNDWDKITYSAKFKKFTLTNLNLIAHMAMATILGNAVLEAASHLSKPGTIEV